MTRILSLLRHAKSDWSASNLDDRDRPLNERGRRAAPRMGAFMAEKDLTPDLILCSSAARARQTLSLASSGMGGAPASRLFDELYLADPDRMLGVLRAEGGEANHVLMLGHNPGMQNLAIRLAETGGGPGSSKEVRRKFPTAALAVFDVASGNWDDFQPSGCRLILFATPRTLAGTDEG